MNRSAFTLLELLLVLGVLGIMAAMSAPRMLNHLKQQTLQGNTERVRQLLDRARVRAVEQGRTLQVRSEPNGRHYIILPHDVADQSNASGNTTTQFREAPVTTEPFRVYQLAEECHFHVDNALLSGESVSVERLDDQWLTEVTNGAEARAIAWSAPILFYPDGTATDGSVVVMDRNRRYMKLRVRGLTGAVSVTSPATMSEKFGATGN
ncbi:MAG TPA: prepilin-type N-terminal cleavage/methylation domain-containing protein [Planctomicrobium sp.]|nr:prepilin-type N-terminal cleavage/methylation domain-containing protein [Planctomicrobium sp.]